MARVYHFGTILCKVWTLFSEIFSKETAPTFQHLFDLVTSILALNGYQSVKFNYEHFIKEDSRYCLNSYYFALNESKIDLDEWTRELIRLSLKLLPVDKTQPLILSVDDTMTEKFGSHFEHYAKMYDHVRHNGSNYLNGHCLVSLLLSIPIMDGSSPRVIHIPIGYRMWTKAKSKLEMAAELVRLAMNTIGAERSVYLCCDSWYPKGAVLALPEQFKNLNLICNVRSDTVLYDLPEPRTGRRGRPRVYGDKLSLDDFELKEVPNSNYRAGYRRVLTNLWGARAVWAIVTQPVSGGSKRLYISTNIPQEGDVNAAYLPVSAQAFSKADTMLLPLAIYAIRWNIEVSFYELKTFWALGDYKLRSQTGMERIINLLALVYSSMELLPYWDSAFAAYKSYSPQQIRFFLGDLIRKERFLTTFANHPNIQKNNPHLADCLRKLALGLLSAA